MLNELYNREAEENLIGACLLDYAALQEVRMAISAKDFSTIEHSLIFSTILKVADEFGITCPVKVADELRKDGDLNRAGGTDKIYELQQKIVETKSAKWNAETVKSFSLRREIVATASKISAQAKDYSFNVADITSELQQAIDDISVSNRQGLSIQTAKELSEQKFPPIKWVIPKLIPSGLTLLAGPPKIGKSFFCWNLAFAVSMGGMALSEIDVEKKRNVLYLALDDDISLVQNRHKQMLYDQSVPDNLHIAEDIYPVKFNTAGLHVLEQIIDEKDIELIIVDTWKHVEPDINGRNKNSYDIDYEKLIPIRKFANHKNIAIILVTHLRKASDIDNPFNQIQGSTGIQAGCDTILMLGRDADRQIILRTTGRKSVENEFVMELRSDGLWAIVGDKVNFSSSEPHNEVLRLLLKAEGLPMKYIEIAERLDKKPDTIKKQLQRLEKERKVVKIARGDWIHSAFENDLTHMPI